MSNIKRLWIIERRIGFTGWFVTHRPTRLVFCASSKTQARRDINSGYYLREIAKQLAVKPAGRRDWYRDPITGQSHLYTGGLFSWHCDIHNRTCDPFKPITVDDVLTLAAKDEHLDDDTFVLLRQVIEDRPLD